MPRLDILDPHRWEAVLDAFAVGAVALRRNPMSTLCGSMNPSSGEWRRCRHEEQAEQLGEGPRLLGHAEQQPSLLSGDEIVRDGEDAEL
jgi:hypothetical protein